MATTKFPSVTANHIKLRIISYHLDGGWQKKELKTKMLLDKISGSYGNEYKMAVFWDVAPCSLVEIN
jgi:hypothetical protein